MVRQGGANAGISQLTAAHKKYSKNYLERQGPFWQL